MGDALHDKKNFTIEEYMEYEKHSEFRHEFYQGEIFAMAGGTVNHSRIITNIARTINLPKSCEVFVEGIKLELIKNEYYVYPDVMVSCNSTDLHADYIFSQPSLIIEVLSKTTESYDRGMKLHHYFRIPSLKYYILVSQKDCLVEVYERQDDMWIYRSFDKPENIIKLANLNIEISVADIYQNVEFRKEESDLRMSN